MSIFKSELPLSSYFKNLPKNTSLCQMLCKQLKQGGHKTFQIDPSTNKTVTYEETLNNSIKLAKAFRKLNLNPNDTIAIFADNNLNYVLPVLASFFNGLTVACFNPLYPEDEIKTTFNLVKPKIVFASKTGLDKLLKAKESIESLKEIVSFDETTQQVLLLDNLIKDENAEDFTCELVDSDKTAVILLSSGTTGLPKAVQLTYQNINESFQKIGDVFPWNATITIGIAPFFHILGLIVLLNTIIATSTIIIISKFRPDVFLESIQKHRVNILFVVPSLLLFFDQSPAIKNYDLSSLEQIYCGGAATSDELVAKLDKKLKVNVLKIYGLTELSGAVSISRPETKTKGSVGQLNHGIELIIRNPETGLLCQEDIPGEICVKGFGAMKGYLNNKLETDNTIVEGFIRTGDIGYYSKGQLFIIDRLKELIKYKGFQVPPAQLESLLLKLEGIKDCAVVGKPDERTGELAVAFIVKQTNCSLTEQDIISYIAEHVSIEKQLHGGVIFIQEIPRNSTGKIARKLLVESFNSTSI